MDFEGPWADRFRETMKACVKLKEMGEPAVFLVSGPMTILNGIVDSDVLFRAILKQPELVMQVFWKLGHDMFKVMKLAESSGVDVISYADPSGGVNLVGPKAAERMARGFTAELMEPMVFYRELRKKNADAHAFMQFATDQLIAFGKVQIRAGADVIAISDPSGTGEILGPKYFKEFAVKYLNQMVDAFRAEGVGTIVHICGQMNPVYEQVAEIRSHVLSFDSVIPMQEARAHLPERVLMGNVSTYALEFGDLEKVLIAGQFGAHLPAETINKGLIDGMDRVGVLYEDGEYFLPEVLTASYALNVGIDVLKPHLKQDESGQKIKVVIGVVEGDTHDIGKNLVKIMSESGGFEVFDLGRDVPLKEFVKTAEEKECDFICMSTLMTTTMPGMRTVIEMLEEKGIRDKYKVLIGGGPVSQKFADEIGADGYTVDAAACVKKMKELKGLLPFFRENVSAGGIFI